MQAIQRPHAASRNPCKESGLRPDDHSENRAFNPDPASSWQNMRVTAGAARFMPDEDPVKCALTAISETDMTLFGITDYGPGRSADPSTLQGRAALYSLAFILRRAAAVYLEDYELKAGIRSRRDARSGSLTGQVFLSDTLENGAGYATQSRYARRCKNPLRNDRAAIGRGIP